jgi:hypothetical protein
MISKIVLALISSITLCSS